MKSGGSWNAGLMVVVDEGNDGPAPGTIDTSDTTPQIITVSLVDNKGTVEIGGDCYRFFKQEADRSGFN